MERSEAARRADYGQGLSLLIIKKKAVSVYAMKHFSPQLADLYTPGDTENLIHFCTGRGAARRGAAVGERSFVGTLPIGLASILSDAT